jgi:uncharacterized protein (DUF952 family)
MKADTFILHLASKTAWLASAEEGLYAPESLSTEGFIHCSTVSQIVGVANTFYRGQRELVLLVIDPFNLRAELKWEPPAEPEPTHAREGELFPHIYGALNPDAVVRALPFEPDAEGLFSLPQEFDR